ncbi:MAG: hypothetical protein WD875_09625, partial [Pirellulales bacterium]
MKQTTTDHTDFADQNALASGSTGRTTSVLLLRSFLLASADLGLFVFNAERLCLISRGWLVVIG